MVSNADNDEFSSNSSVLEFNENNATNAPLSSSHNNQASMVKMKTIPMKEYKRLVDASVDLIKANQEIKRLTKRIKRKDTLLAEIEKKRKQIRLSKVSL